MTYGQVAACYRHGHGDNPVLLQSAADVDTLIDELLASEPWENMASLYSMERPSMTTGVPDHELWVGADGARQVGVLGLMDDGNFVSLGPANGRDEVAYGLMEHRREFPENSEIPIALVRQAVKEFLCSGGQRPTCIQWQEPEYW
ncbi:Imm1 family immunity protein [Streptomyces sp. HGB0020]|uniref:Imm1 family immunity protein n=1 Tax=Streptomyces sp. HGB0020 TaxID=1078086 RepID=UPI000685940C|nr:Imm1 family immunity protein [Streptomyces sp. HGB0020]